MSDMRGFGAREMEPTSSKSKAIAAFVVAIGVGAAGAYVYTSNGGLPHRTQQQQLAMNEPAPITPPPAQTAIPTMPQAEKTPAPDIAAPVTLPAQTTASAPTIHTAQHVARVKARTEQPQQPALTPPDTTTVPDIPAQTVAPPAAPVPEQTTPSSATPETNQPPSSDQPQSTPQ
jgi:hypothetical protein